MQHHKNLCVNTDGSHAIPVTFVRHAKTSTALKQTKFHQLRYQYMSQPDSWMDGVRFENWINQWYNLIRKKTYGPWCLLMDNRGRYELDVTFPGVQIVYFLLKLLRSINRSISI